MQKTDSICEQISRSLKEGKWLAITYDNQEKKEDTSFWCAIKDIDPEKQSFNIEMYNHSKGPEAIPASIYFEKIKSAQVIELSTFDTNSELIERIENNRDAYSWLQYEKFDNNILQYLIECNRLDSDPYQKNYAMISGIDAHVLKENKKYKLSPEQVDEMIKLIYLNDLERFDNSFSELALSALSVDIRGRKYVVAYYHLLFDPKTKELRIKGEIKFNESFLIGDNPEERRKHTLHEYTEISAEEFKLIYLKDRSEAEEILREGFNRGEMIDTRPDMMLLERTVPVDLGTLFGFLEQKHENGTLPVPMKAFFGDISKHNNGRIEPDIVIYDNKINIDQISVMYNALKNPVTYVQGPPGTGKTQTLFNTILSCYFNDKNALVVSNNNRPVEGIIEKLVFKTEKGGTIPFPYLRLGNKEILKKETLKIKWDFLRDFSKIKPDDIKINGLKTKEAMKNAQLVKLLSDYNERKAIEESINDIQELIRQNPDSSNVLYQEITRLKNKLYETSEVTNEMVLKLFEPAKESYRYQQYLFFSSLLHLEKLQSPKYNELRQIVNIEDDDTRVSQFNKWCRDDKNMKLLTSAYPVIFSTNISSNRLGSGEFLFDLVIMDEAGQADLARSLIPISRARSLLLVGDNDQLKPVIMMEESTNEKLMEKYKISHNYDYFENSILSTMTNVDNISKSILLSYHYRCGKKIIGFSNQYFYNSKLKINADMMPGNVSLINVENQPTTEKRNSYYHEAQAIVDYVERNDVKDAVIITPFVNQENLINALLEKRGLKNKASACTIHRIQGGEAKTVIVSYALSKKTSERTFEWLTKQKEIANVAVTRAQENLVIVCDEKAVRGISKDKINVWNELVSYAKANGEYTVAKPEIEEMPIGKSNYSKSEEEFYKTMSMFCTVNKKYNIKRNVPLKEVFKDDETLQKSKQEFDLVIEEKSFFGSYHPRYVFEINGGEHLGDAKREGLDTRKRKICEDKKIKLIYIDNNNVKNYELIRELILKINKKKYEQTFLFEDPVKGLV